MQQNTKSIITSIIDVVKAMYKIEGEKIAKKIKNIDYINIDTLANQVEKELAPEEINKNTERIVSLIESIIED